MKLFELDRKTPLDKHKPTLLKIAQQVYDSWDEDDEDTYAGGGICHLIADKFVEYFVELGYDATSFNTSVGENHVMTAVKVPDEEGDTTYIIDIPPYIYERGGGYSWTKIPGVEFTLNDISIELAPGDFEDYELE